MNLQHRAPSALIAEDEPVLAAFLEAALQEIWPSLSVLDVVDNGILAAQRTLDLRPDILFFDIRMPGQSGLEAAAELTQTWPVDVPFPMLVFVTAYDQYAIQAFEAQAIDYLLKPVKVARLALTVQRLQQAWNQRQQKDANATLEQAMQQLLQLQSLMRSQPSSQPHLKILQASIGNTIHMVPIEDVVYLEAADKYVRVLTATQEFLIRTPLKELLMQLDPAQFWQVHRGTVVRAASIASAQRDETGRMSLTLRERPETLAVSRLHAQQFKSM